MAKRVRIEFFKDKVIYMSVVNGNAYSSFHNRSNLTDAQAKKAFHREHEAEVLSLIIEQKQKSLTHN